MNLKTFIQHKQVMHKRLHSCHIQTLEPPEVEMKKKIYNKILVVQNSNLQCFALVDCEENLLLLKNFHAINN